MVGFFKHLGFPTWMIYPLATAKILAIVAILSRKSLVLHGNAAFPAKLRATG